MNTFLPTARISPFMAAHLIDFLSNFGISFSIDGPQLEYFVFKKETGLDVSCSLTIGFDGPTNRIDVMTFYPGLNLHPNTRYLSSVCFFMVMQHFANFHHIGADCKIQLSTRRNVFDSFYGLLKDFDFHVMVRGEEDRVDIEGHFLPLGIDTSMFDQRALPDDYVV